MNTTHNVCSRIKKITWYGMWTLLWSIPLVVIAFLIFIAYVQRIEIQSITVTGDVSFTAEDIKQQTHLTLPALYLTVSSSVIAKKLENHPLVYSANVKKTLDGQLVIYLTRSVPLVAIVATVDGIQTPAYFDKNGKCVQVGSRGGIVDVPIVSGLALVNPQLGVYVPQWVQEFLAHLSTIKTEDSTLFNSVSEFTIVSGENDYRMLEVWFVQFAQKYITSMNITTKVLEKIQAFADKISTESSLRDFESFDVRQGVIIGKKTQYEKTI